ncbi:MAG TPA: ATP-binding protein, partial [Streptosporangiaceae bacterium]
MGREDVLARLSHVVAEAMAGAGRVVLLAGEAGIGKTTVLAEAARDAEDRGARVAWGWGWPGEGAPGYWPWLQVIRGLGLDVPRFGAPTQASAPGSVA